MRNQDASGLLTRLATYNQSSCKLFIKRVLQDFHNEKFNPLENPLCLEILQISSLQFSMLRDACERLP
jgi:hypothetical protein